MMSSPSSDSAPPGALWSQLHERLQAKELLGGHAGGLSLRIAGSDAMWFGLAADPAPVRVAWRSGTVPPGAEIHAAVYSARPDVGAVAVGGGPFSTRLADFGGCMPGVFDEQVRHLGRMAGPARDVNGIPQAVAAGGNVLIVGATPVCLGTTAARLAMNAELFEKSAKAWVLATAAGGPVRPLPWIVRWVANGRLMKDERRAAQRFATGLLPEETRGY
jgi:hypothetical protein